jgi:hypothetical protein
MTDPTSGQPVAAAQDPEAERIVSEIEVTRYQMGATIDQIGHRLQPQTIANETRDKIREATIGKVERMVDDAGQTAGQTGTTLMETIRQNPVPAALAGLGIGWLVFRMRDQSPMNGSSTTKGGYGSMYGKGRSGDTPVDRARGVAQTATQNAQQVGSDIQQAAQSTVEDAQYKVQQAQWQAQDAVQTAQLQAQDAVQNAQWQIDRTMNENPLALGALAIGVGAAVALALPSTQKEREMMGEPRDQIVEKVSTAATQMLDQAQTQAQQVAEKISQDSGSSQS